MFYCLPVVGGWRFAPDAGGAGTVGSTKTPARLPTGAGRLEGLMSFDSRHGDVQGGILHAGVLHGGIVAKSGSADSSGGSAFAQSTPADKSFTTCKRADLHCHSQASCDGAEAVLDAISCPESFSAPIEVYQQAQRRGMDFFTLTDHDTIAGAATIEHFDRMIVGEELTCWFPEDQCKMHVLVWGIDQRHHDHLQSIAGDIYKVANYIERENLAHSVAHPLYRQNDRLERWHVERLILLFKGFECLNGAHSGLHRDAFEPLLDRMTPAELTRLSERHELRPRWSRPWEKSRTAGSDDHGLLNVGRTWTEFPAHVQTVNDVLQCLRDGSCRAGGEAGTSSKLAHTFYSVAVRYYSRTLQKKDSKPNLATAMLQTMVGERPAPSKLKLATTLAWQKAKSVGNKIRRPFGGAAETGTQGMLGRLFMKSAQSRITEHPALLDALKRGLPPLGEHDEMSKLISSIDSDLTRGIADAVRQSVGAGKLSGIFDGISASLMQQFVMLPYYFSLFHQNKERHLLRSLTGQLPPVTSENMRVGLFTDTLDEVNGVARFISTMGRQSVGHNRSLIVHTCSEKPVLSAPWRKNFTPTLSTAMPYYKGLSLNLPPVRDILDWADRQQFDAIHISTPGPMGLCGYLVGRMLRVPILGTYHTDFPAYADQLTGDHRLTSTTTHFMKWFYGQMDLTFSRSKQYLFNLRELGLDPKKLEALPPCVDNNRFHPVVSDRDEFWKGHGITQPLRLLYCGRVSKEKNLPMLVEIFKKLSAGRKDVALVIAGDGPYMATMKAALKGTPTYFLGSLPNETLPAVYSAADLLVFPSRTDTLGQVVLEAAACGLPAMVTLDGGPRDLVEQDATGVLLPGDDAKKWLNALGQLLDDPAKRTRLSRAAAARALRMSETATFEAFWGAHAAVAEKEPVAEKPANSDSSQFSFSSAADSIK
jgi:glycosyltransferase involved in cell wall biosynthesis